MSASTTKQQAFKVLLIGDSAVGKSSLMLRFVNNSFDPDISSTIGIDFKIKTLDVIDGTNGTSRTVTAQLWDTAGQERFRTLTSSYYRGAHGVVLVYDVNEPSTFEGVNKWLSEAKNFLGGDEDVVYLLIGNKTDLAREKGLAAGEYAVPKETAQRFAAEHKMMFALCSAKTKEGVMHAFEEVVRKAYDKRNKASSKATLQSSAAGGVDLASGGSSGGGGGSRGGKCC